MDIFSGLIKGLKPLMDATGTKTDESMQLAILRGEAAKLRGKFEDALAEMGQAAYDMAKSNSIEIKKLLSMSSRVDEIKKQLNAKQLIPWNQILRRLRNKIVNIQMSRKGPGMKIFIMPGPLNIICFTSFQNPLYLLRKVDKPSHLEGPQILFLVQFHCPGHLLQGHKHNRMLCKHTYPFVILLLIVLAYAYIIDSRLIPLDISLLKSLFSSIAFFSANPFLVSPISIAPHIMLLLINSFV